MPILTGKTLGLRFALALVLLFVVGTLAFGFLVARGTGRDFSSHSDEILERCVNELKVLFSDEADDQEELLDKAVGHLSGNVGSELSEVPYDVFEGRDDLLLSYLKERLEEARRRNAENAGVISSQFRLKSQERMKEAFAALEADQQAESSRLARAIFRDMLIWGGVFLLGLSVFVGILFWATVLKPLRAATHVIEEIRAGDSKRRIDLTGTDEIDRLAVSFNSMADEIETYKLGASAKMEALETMAGGMAHEFNNILGGIQGCAQDLLEDAADGETREVLEVIVRTSRRASVITDNLLRFSRGGHRVTAYAAVDEIVEEAVKLAGPDADTQGVSLACRGEIPEPVLTDPQGLQQVILNLLLNAIQATDRGGEVSVVVGIEDGICNIEVTDDGCGIPEDVLPHVFEPFFSTKSTTADRQGTGLGLSVSQGIMRALGGDITVSSGGPGLGSRFVVTIPPVEDVRE